MNPNDHNQPWARLTAAARRAPLGGETAAPYGFSTRVAALAFAAERPIRSLFERFSIRAVAVAGLLAVLSVAANYSALVPVASAASEDELVAGVDPVSVFLAPIE